MKPSGEKITVAADALFDFNKAVLRPAGKAKLDELVAKAKAINLEVIKLRNASSVSSLTQKKGLGSLDTATLQRGLQVYRDIGVLSREIAVNSIVGTDLLPAKP